MIASLETGVWLVPRDGLRWHFDTGSRALDFAYTGNFDLPRIEWEMLHTPSDLTAWLRGHVDRGLAEATADDLAEGLRLRRAIAMVARAFAVDDPAEPADLAVIDEFAAEPDVPPQLRAGTPLDGWPVGRGLSTVARHAVVDFGAGPERFHECGGDHCLLIFRDTSRPGSRAWCSMGRCGNRTKMRARQARAVARRDPGSE